MDMYVSFKEYEEMKMTGKEKILKSDAFSQVDIAIILKTLQINLEILKQSKKLEKTDKELAMKVKVSEDLIKGVKKKVERIAKEAGINVKDVYGI